MKIIIAAALAALFACPAYAQRNCGPRDDVRARLAEGYGETRQAVGLVSNGALMEIYGSLETGSWTLTLTQPNGLTCLMASGQSLEVTQEALPAQGEEM